jgi:outer membrane immunogenic protein
MDRGTSNLCRRDRGGCPRLERLLCRSQRRLRHTDFRFGPITLFTQATPPEGVTFDVGGSTSGSGPIGGVQAGFNLQHGSFVFGIEGDIQYAGIDADQVMLADFPQSNDTTTVDLRLSSFGTIRGRVAVVADRLLAYATGGLAIGHLDATVRVTDLGGYDESDSDAHTHYGYAVGGGVEYALTGNWTAKAEYLYANFGPETYNLVFPTPSSGDFEASSSADFSLHLVRLGVNYNF